MKKSYVMTLVLATAVVFSGCGSVGQSGSSNLLGSSSNLITGNALTNAGTGMLGTLLTTLLGKLEAQNSV